MDVMSKIAPNFYTAARVALGGAETQTPVKPQITTPEEAGPTFGDSLVRAAQDTLAGLRQAEAVSKDAIVGRADPHSVVEALAATELALETAVTVRDRVVEAYQEILRMPV